MLCLDPQFIVELVAWTWVGSAEGRQSRGIGRGARAALETGLGDFHSLEHGLGFIQGFFVFTGGD